MVLGTVSPTHSQLPEASGVEIQIQEALVLPSSFSTSSTLRASAPPQCHTGKQTNDPTWGSLMLARSISVRWSCCPRTNKTNLQKDSWTMHRATETKTCQGDYKNRDCCFAPPQSISLCIPYLSL